MESPAFISKFVHHKLKPQGGDERHVSRDWLIMLLLSSVMLIGVGLWSFYFYLGIERGDFFAETTTASGGSVSLNRETLDTMLTFIDKKKSQHEALRVASPNIVNPSK